MSDPKFDNNLERFKIALETRNFEIELFWKRCNYFLVLNTALAVGVFALFGVKDTVSPLVLPLICVVGIFVCVAWIHVGLGSKFWQCHWEQVVIREQHTIGFCKGDGSNDRKDYFSQEDAPDQKTDNWGGPKARVKENLGYENMPEESEDIISDCCSPCNIFDSEKRKELYNRCVLSKPSVSRWMHGTAVFFFWVWVVMLMLGSIWALWKSGFWAWVALVVMLVLGGVIWVLWKPGGFWARLHEDIRALWCKMCG